MSTIFDDRPCELGEGPLWHPERRQLFWFDIIGKRLMTRERGTPKSWSFDEHVSVAGWVDRDTFLMASETGLWRFDLQSGKRNLITPLEADNPITRSNDGRADPWGGFWIGTMGKQAEPGAGSIYRFWKGELRRLVPNVTISNAICFAPDRSVAYFCDTATKQVRRWRLNPETGWPEGDSAVFLDLRKEGLNPDGAVIDAQGNIWIAQWGASRVAAYTPDGMFLKAVAFDASHTSCPAFGGDELNTLFCTTARQGLSAEAIDSQPTNGMTFAARNAGQGQAEHKVIL
ncbi:SMP-30/gluconolactonase/LRE family protein [Ruegeria sp. HKCCD6604]|uniref:SMP-30/gluconolactonase/LRE family protein n=1 Tax=Ruegeria sp. HKCCD6604 TaxID=2683000 RepID=UPI001492F39F|nr:SMP-30/gluconolactonase/LRE family protein [Ruegeria sp. HKCCD6604]NOC92683.1 SMP-30/gluconolactonase/LRE family protein [Ruegeria sp. HKCCD6604]